MADLLSLARAEQEYAKVLLRRRWGSHAVTLALGLVGLVLLEPLVYVAPVLALGSESYAWWLRFQAEEAHERAEEGRRRAVLIRELGAGSREVHASTVRVEFSSRARATASQWADPDYFAAEDRPGPRRLLESLQESAFWSCHLYRAAGRERVLALVGLVAVIVGSLVAVFSIEADGATAAARAATVMLTVLVASDELGFALSFFSAGRSAGRVVERLEAVTPDSLAQVLAVYGDYSTATALAAPIPTRLYKRHHDAIDEAWRDRLGETATSER